MSTPTTITIDGTEYIRKQDAVTIGSPTEYRIIVADRGWVFVGHCVDEDDGAVTIADAKCIRYWGTDNDRPGLGWLALNGPTDKTKLDASGTVRVPAHSVVAVFDSDAARWV